MKTREEARWQASKLRFYLSNGGSWKQWWKSKDFDPGFRRIVREEFSALLREDIGRDPVYIRNKQLVEWVKCLGSDR